MNKKRVVITGVGVISPIGIGKELFFTNLKEGKSGIDTITRFDPEKLSSKIAGEVKDFEPSEYINKKEVRRMDRYSQFAVAASRMALEDSNLNLEKIDENRMGVCIGSGIGGIETFENQYNVMIEKGPNRISPFFIPMMISNIAAGHISMTFKARGPNMTIVTACASATNAIGEAFKIIQRNDADIMFTGGSEASITLASVAGFCSMKALSERNDDPKSASRPFDKERDGFIMSEGSGILVIEELEHALKRGARIYGEIAGYGSSADAYHVTAPAPEGEGAYRAMMKAITDGGVEPSDIDYINAHGTSTPLNDKFETIAIKRLLGENAYKTPISSTKSMTGHLLGAAGAVEAIACLLPLNEGIIPPTINYKTKDPDCDLDYVANEYREKAVTNLLSNSLGFGGHNASILLKKYI